MPAAPVDPGVAALRDATLNDDYAWDIVEEPKPSRRR